MSILRRTLATFAIILPGLNVAAAEGEFCASCVKMDITPDTPQWLHGYGPRKSEGVHDRIFHRIVAMDDGSTTFFLVATDVCTISPSFRDEVCRKLERETGIRSEQIWWTATHTHAAPHVGPQDLGQLFSKTLGNRFSMVHDKKHWEFVAGQLIEGVKKARARLEPARLGIGVGEAFANINRRERKENGRIVLGRNPDGPVDRQLGLIRLERRDGKLIGLIANYAIHATVLGGNNKLISGDVPGLVARYVETMAGAPLLFVNGAEGNVGPLYNVGADFKHAHWDTYNKLLGDRILALNKSIKSTTDQVHFSLGNTVIETPRKAGLGWLDELSDYSSVSDDGTPLVRIPVWSLVINNSTVIWAAPLELFSEMAIAVRSASPFSNTFYFGLTNGSLLYMPTTKAFTELGYEVGVSPYTVSAERDLTSGVIQHLRKLRRQKVVH
jgi:neutral ceramidase